MVDKRVAMSADRWVDSMAASMAAKMVALSAASSVEPTDVWTVGSSVALSVESWVD